MWWTESDEELTKLWTLNKNVDEQSFTNQLVDMWLILCDSKLDEKSFSLNKQLKPRIIIYFINKIMALFMRI